MSRPRVSPAPPLGGGQGCRPKLSWHSSVPAQSKKGLGLQNYRTDSWLSLRSSWLRIVFVLHARGKVAEGFQYKRGGEPFALSLQAVSCLARSRSGVSDRSRRISLFTERWDLLACGYFGFAANWTTSFETRGLVSTDADENCNKQHTLIHSDRNISSVLAFNTLIQYTWSKKRWREL